MRQALFPHAPLQAFRRLIYEPCAGMRDPKPRTEVGCCRQLELLRRAAG